MRLFGMAASGAVDRWRALRRRPPVIVACRHWHNRRRGGGRKTGLPRVCSPSGSEGLRPPFHRTRTVAWAAQAKPGCARMGSDGRHYIGIDVSKDRLDVRASFRRSLCGRPQRRRPAQLVVRLQAIAPALIAVEATGGFETVVAGEPGERSPAGRRRQSGAGPPLRAGARQTRQDRSDRRRGHRPLRRGDAARGARPAGRGYAVRRSLSPAGGRSSR